MQIFLRHAKISILGVEIKFRWRHMARRHGEARGKLVGKQKSSDTVGMERIKPSLIFWARNKILLMEVDAHIFFSIFFSVFFHDIMFLLLTFQIKTCRKCVFHIFICLYWSMAKVMHSLNSQYCFLLMYQKTSFNIYTFYNFINFITYRTHILRIIGFQRK